MIKDKKILMTGGAGFIGTNICAELCENNEILLYDNLRRNSIKSSPLLNEKIIRLIQGDVLELNHLKKVTTMFKPDIIIHLAAIKPPALAIRLRNKPKLKAEY